MDDVDRAQAISDAFLDEALSRPSRVQAERVSRIVCVGCGEQIPERRRRAVITEHCIECAEALEKFARKY